MNSKNLQIVFELLQASLCQRSVDVTKFCSVTMEEERWTLVLQFLYDHSLLALVADKILSLPSALLPSERQRMELLRLCDVVKNTHENMNRIVAEVFEVLESHGHKPVLLKGQGLAALYPVANVRSCGDVDIFIGNEGFEDACHVVESYCGLGHGIVKKVPTNIHYCVRRGQIKFELHYLAAKTAISSINEDYNRWAEEYLLDSTNDFVTIRNREIRIPSNMMNIVFVFEHLLKHLREEGVGLRQFVDWMILLKRYAGEIDVVELEQSLERFHIKDAWQVLGGILVYQLGLPKDLFPLWNEKKAKYSQGRNLEYVLYAYDMGRGIGKYKGYFYMSPSIKRDILAFRYSIWHTMFMYHVFPYDAIGVYLKNIYTKLKG